MCNKFNTTIMSQKDTRVISFSCKKSDLPSTLAVENLKKYCKSSGLSFSFMVLKAIKQLNKKIENGSNKN